MGWFNQLTVRDWFSARSLKGKPLVRPNLAYLRWRYGGNASRTLRALANRLAYPETQGIADQLIEQGVVVGPSTQFLTDGGRAALAEASASVLSISRSDEVQAVI